MCDFQSVSEGVREPMDKERDCLVCGCPMSRNPHPDAGKPGRMLQVGGTWECIPCAARVRAEWAERVAAAEAEPTALRRREPAVSEEMRERLERRSAFLKSDARWLEGMSAAERVDVGRRKLIAAALRGASQDIRHVLALLRTPSGEGEAREYLTWWEAQRTRVLAPIMESSGWRMYEWDGDGFRPVGPHADTLIGAIRAARRSEGGEDVA